MNPSSLTRFARMEIARHGLNFSIAHFTIFSAVNRENLHGHTFQVQCELVAPVLDNGLTFDYGIIKKTVREICDSLDEKTVLPDLSPYLRVERDNEYITALFNKEKLFFLPRDVLILPVRNTTVEELSNYILERLLDAESFKGKGIVEITIKVSSSPGQTGCTTWKAE